MTPNTICQGLDAIGAWGARRWFLFGIGVDKVFVVGSTFPGFGLTLQGLDVPVPSPQLKTVVCIEGFAAACFLYVPPSVLHHGAAFLGDIRSSLVWTS